MMYHFDNREYWIQIIRALVDIKVQFSDYNLEEIHKEVVLNIPFR